MDKDSLRRQLTAILEKTAYTRDFPGGGFWVGDIAAERQVLDDLRSGRLELRAARDHAEAGLSALDGGDLEMASVCLTSALWLYIDALEKRVPPEGKRLLRKPAGKRGRPRSTVDNHKEKNPREIF